jgi:hypothetical protein
VATVGENPSAKGCLPEVEPRLTKIPLIDYVFGSLELINYPFKSSAKEF